MPLFTFWIYEVELRVECFFLVLADQLNEEDETSAMDGFLPVSSAAWDADGAAESAMDDDEFDDEDEDEDEIPFESGFALLDSSLPGYNEGMFGGVFV